MATPTHKALVITTNYGVEQDELVVPTEELSRLGVDVTIAAEQDEPIQTLVGDKDPGRTVAPNATLEKVDPDDYGLVIIPGGTVNADTLRLNSDAVGIVQKFAAAGRPVAAICHGPWLAVEADVVRGKSLTSYPSLQTDIRNAGAASWVDQPVVADTTEGYVLITSRKPDDLKDFVGAIADVLELD
jgi:protease I